MKLTERSIAKLKAPDPSGSQKLHWDDGLKGFGVLVSGTSNAKSYIVQRTLPGGRTRRITIGRTNVVTLTEATVRAKELLGAFYRGIDPKAGRRGDHTLRSALTEYLAIRTDLRPRSAEAYRDSVTRHLKPWLDLPLREITRPMVEDRLKKIARDVANESNHNGHAAANSAMRALRVLYNFASDRAPPTNPLPPNPVKLKKVWLEVQPRTRHLSGDELPKFYAAVCELDNQVSRDFILTLLFTGLRRREAAGLRWEHIDLKHKVIRLPATSTKAKRPLDLPMSDFVYDLLARRRALGDTTWVFPAPSRSGHIEEPRHPLDLVHAATGIYVSAHDLRRSYVTAAESTDMSVLALKALVNHALGNDVTAGYVQMNVDRLREPAQRVCDRLKLLCGISVAQVPELL
ncbi:MAG: tyrosine-type recombinase/integrase [Xanthobacteraceae bacterium]